MGFKNIKATADEKGWTVAVKGRTDGVFQPVRKVKEEDVVAVLINGALLLRRVNGLEGWFAREQGRTYLGRLMATDAIQTSLKRIDAYREARDKEGVKGANRRASARAILKEKAEQRAKDEGLVWDALHDWGPLTTQDLLTKTELSNTRLRAALRRLKAQGWGQGKTRLWDMHWKERRALGR